MNSSMFFQDWTGVLRVVVLGVIAYAALILALRATGKRTLSKLNAFDLVVTVAIGSTFGSILTSSSLPLAEGLAALALLILLQYVVTFASVRSRRVAQLVKSEPTLLLRKGECLPAAMRRERVTEEEVLAAVRSSGGRQLEDAEVVVLESDGSLSAILS